METYKFCGSGYSNSVNQYMYDLVFQYIDIWGEVTNWGIYSSSYFNITVCNTSNCNSATPTTATTVTTTVPKITTNTTADTNIDRYTVINSIVNMMNNFINTINAMLSYVKTD